MHHLGFCNDPFEMQPTRSKFVQLGSCSKMFQNGGFPCTLDEMNVVRTILRESVLILYLRFDNFASVVRNDGAYRPIPLKLLNTLPPNIYVAI